jgi:hypothetical protein
LEALRYSAEVSTGGDVGMARVADVAAEPAEAIAVVAAAVVVASWPPAISVVAGDTPGVLERWPVALA